ncbi:hypothetical protein WA026_013101 [Henosepilachna vigintioctopunctata]|uniref:Retrotransposon gag domain-containing protein n=1 Tax=Henosepilachna vigintioctopunctata TaxID=420089 RepID=A0AAW1UIY3_9CUCU
MKTTPSEELDIFSKVKHFVVDKYNGSQNAEEWINIFEKECDRLRVDLDVSKIQILRLFLEGNAVEWYKATLSNSSIYGTWNQWSQHFSDTYAFKNWCQVFYAKWNIVNNGYIVIKCKCTSISVMSHVTRVYGNSTFLPLRSGLANYSLMQVPNGFFGL